MHQDSRLEQISIASPCHKSWVDMPGTDVRRFCDSCSLHVHNLSAMTPGEATSFMEEQPADGRVCVTYLPGPQGGIVTRESVLPTRFGWFGKAASLLFGLLMFLPGCKPAEANPKPVVDDPQCGVKPTDWVEDPNVEGLRVLGGIGYVMGEAVMPDPIVIEGRAPTDN